MKGLIKRLTEAFGPSGSEEEVRELIKSEIEGLVSRVETDPLGNLCAIREGAGGGRRVMLAAHMDEIGVMVTHIDEKGFLRFAPIGGVNRLTLLGSRMVFANGVVGSFGLEERGRERPPQRERVPRIDQTYLDVGAPDKDSVPVRIGDAACFQRGFVDLGQRMVAKSFDDRIGCAVLIQVMRELRTSPHNVSFVFTVQEEVGLRGATTSAYAAQPDLAIAVDVTTTGDTPEARTMAVSLGQGPAIKVKDRGMLAHPAVRRLLVETAEELGIPYQLEVLERGTTGAMAIQVSREGVPTGVLSIPTRYVHTPSQIVDYADVENAVKLLVGLLSKPINLG